MSEKKSKTQVISTTNTKLAVATVALLLAGGLAFAAAPLGQGGGVGGGQCGLKKKVTVSQSCKGGRYRKATFSCTTGASYTYFDPNKKSTANCYTKGEWQAFATHICSSICQPPAVEPAPALQKGEGNQQIRSISRADGGAVGVTTTPTSTPPAQRLRAAAPQEISACGRLAEGEYILTTDIEIPAPAPGVYSSCFELPSNVILRCNQGVTIRGGERTIGVSVGNNSEVAGCTFEGVARPIIVAGTNGRVTGNTVIGGAEGSEYSGAITVYDQNHVISGNTVRNSTGVGVLLADTQNVEVRYNAISDSAHAAVSLANRAQEDTLNNTVSQNNLTRNRFGVFILGISTANTISENIIEQNGSGIFLRNSFDIRILNNQINNNTSQGIYIESDRAGAEPQHLLIRGNTLQLNQDNGIFLPTEENTIDSNRFEGNTMAGIHLIGSQNTITNNIFQSNGRHGVYTYTGERNTLQGNQFIDNGAGIVLDGSAEQATVAENTFTRNRTGIAVSGGQQSELRANTFSENEYGIKVLERSADTLIVDNVINNSSIDGIFLGLGGSEASRELAQEAGLQLPPPLRTVIRNTRGCTNTRADLYCQIQRETSGIQNTFGTLTQCAQGEPIDVEFQECQ